MPSDDSRANRERPHGEAKREEAQLDVASERAAADAASALRDEFLAIASHDLRNLLNNMVLFATLIAEGVLQEDHVERVLKHAERIVSSGGRMDRLIGDMLDVASIDAGKFEVVRDISDLRALVTEAVVSLQARALAREVSLVSSIAPAPLLVAFDARRMLKVLSSLLGNAIDHAPAEGKVSVDAELRADEVWLCVRDTGPGIAATELEAIFDRFAHVPSGGRRRLGLGLFLSKYIVQAHGGRIWAVSQVGHGATFFVTLPRQR